MSRDEGFAVMDVSTDLLNDPKVRKLLRYAPDRYPVAMLAYVSTMADSWKSGRRVNVEEAWPTGIVFDRLAVEALTHVDLLDESGFIATKTWRGWFGKAKARRAKVRADWRKWQNTHRRQGGVSPDSGPTNPDSVPDKSIPSVSQSDPSVPPKGLTTTSISDVGRARPFAVVEPDRETA